MIEDNSTSPSQSSKKSPKDQEDYKLPNIIHPAKDDLEIIFNLNLNYFLPRLNEHNVDQGTVTKLISNLAKESHRNQAYNDLRKLLKKANLDKNDYAYWAAIREYQLLDDNLIYLYQDLDGQAGSKLVNRIAWQAGKSGIKKFDAKSFFEKLAQANLIIDTITRNMIESIYQDFKDRKPSNQNKKDYASSKIYILELASIAQTILNWLTNHDYRIVEESSAQRLAVSSVILANQLNIIINPGIPNYYIYPELFDALEYPTPEEADFRLQVLMKELINSSPAIEFLLANLPIVPKQWQEIITEYSKVLESIDPNNPPEFPKPKPKQKPDNKKAGEKPDKTSSPAKDKVSKETKKEPESSSDIQT